MQKSYVKTQANSSLKIEDIGTRKNLLQEYKGGFNIRKSKSIIYCVDRS